MARDSILLRTSGCRHFVCPRSLRLGVMLLLAKLVERIESLVQVVNIRFSPKASARWRPFQVGLQVRLHRAKSCCKSPGRRVTIAKAPNYERTAD